MSDDPDIEWRSIDATVIRAQAQAARAWVKGGVQAQAFIRSRGGSGTKIHALVDAPWPADSLHPRSRQQNDMAPAHDLIRGIRAGKVLADRAYDADSLHDLIYKQGGEPVILPCRHRIYQHPYDRIAYKQRWTWRASWPS